MAEGAAEDKHEQLKKCKECIQAKGLAKLHADSLEKRGISVDDHLNPSKHWEKCTYYNVRINNDIKKNFKQYLSKKLSEEEPIIELQDKQILVANGCEWDKLLSDYIKLLKTNKVTEAKNEAEGKVAEATKVKEKLKALAQSKKATKAEKAEKEEEANAAQTEEAKRVRELNKIQVAEKLVGKLYETYEGLKFVDSKFPLFGFMKDDSDKAKIPKPYLWQGEADAIALYGEKYVIVDFKVVETDILGYQERATDLCGKHLHQCLIYARLLKLHMGLDYLPPILIVVIDGSNGWQIYPPLFEDYPSECIEKLGNFKWSKDQFTEMPTLRLVDDGTLTVQNTMGTVDTGKKLSEIFHKEATVKNLLDALGYGSLNVVRVNKEETLASKKKKKTMFYM